VALSHVNAGAASFDNASPLSPSLPSGIQEGDLLVLVCAQTTASGVAFAASGWTSIARNSNATRAMTLEVFAKYATASESAPTVTCDLASSGWICAIDAYRGAKLSFTALEDATEVLSNAAAAATFTPSSITLATVGAMVLSVVATKDDNALGLSVVNGYTTTMSGAAYDGTTGNGSDYAIGLAYQVYGSTGAKTCPTWQQTAVGSDAWLALTIAIAPRTDTTVTPDAATITITGSAPTVTAGAGTVVTPAAATISITGSAPTVLTPRLVTPAAAEIAVTGHAPTVLTPRRVEPAAATIALTGHAPTVSTPRVVTPAAASVVVTGHAPTVVVGKTVTPDAATISISGHAPTVQTPRVVTPAAASVAITGSAPTVLTPRVVTPGAASIVVTGHAPTVSVSADVVAEPDAAAISIVGHAPSVNVGVRATPDAASIAITGHAPTVSTPVVARPAAATVAITGSAPTVLTPRVVVPAAASVVITGHEPTVTVAPVAVEPEGDISVSVSTLASAVVVAADEVAVESSSLYAALLVDEDEAEVDVTTVYLKKGDTAPNLDATLTDSAGAALNLTGAAVTFRMRARGSTTLKVNAAATVVSAAAGTVRYDWLSADVDTDGTYDGEFLVTYGDATTRRAPTRGFIEIIISAST
jgi:hypothetical protein